MREKKSNFTSSTLWLLPIYKIPNKEWQRAGLQDVYLEDEVATDRVYSEKVVRLLFQIDEYKYQLIEDAIDVLQDVLVDQYGHGNDLMVLVLRIPQEYIENGDYDKIMEGRFTELSSEYKALVSNRLDTVMSEAAHQSNGKRLQLMIMEKNKVMLKTVMKMDVNMSNVAEGQIWEKPVISEEIITQSILNQYK